MGERERINFLIGRYVGGCGNFCHSKYSTCVAWPSSSAILTFIDSSSSSERRARDTNDDGGKDTQRYDGENVGVSVCVSKRQSIVVRTDD